MRQHNTSALLVGGRCALLRPTYWGSGAVFRDSSRISSNYIVRNASSLTIHKIIFYEGELNQPMIEIFQLPLTVVLADVLSRQQVETGRRKTARNVSE